MTQLLFEILTDDELKRLKSVGLTRNVRIRDLTVEELLDLGKVFWPESFNVVRIDCNPCADLLEIVKQLKARRAL